MNYSQLCRKILHINPNHWFLSVWFKYWILFIRIFDKLYIKFTTLIFPLNLGAAYQFENTSTRNGWHLKRPFSFKTRFWFLWFKKPQFSAVRRTSTAVFIVWRKKTAEDSGFSNKSIELRCHSWQQFIITKLWTDLEFSRIRI